MTEIETSSLLFDSIWYLVTYSDVASVNADPMGHYLQFGYKEGRNPNRFFDTNFYIQNNPDVANSAINPFIHYILYGASEGRLPRPAGKEPLPYISVNNLFLPPAPVNLSAFTPQKNYVKTKTKEEGAVSKIPQKKTVTRQRVKAKTS